MHRHRPARGSGLAAGARELEHLHEPTETAPTRASVAARRRARTRRLPCALVLMCLGALGWAPSALAHAQLLDTSPQSGVTLQRQPKEVIFKFNEAVGGTAGAVRVYGAQGNEVDNLDVEHPSGHEHWMGVGLRAHLPVGTYTATYRVISADTHIVYGGLVFSIGHPGATRFTVAGLIGRDRSGKLTEVAFGVVHGLEYVSIALLIGGLAFLLLGWLPALETLAGPRARRAAAARAFSAGLQRLLLAAAALGTLVSALGILLQGASAAGVSLWASLKGSIVQDTLESRFGEVWGARLIVWLALAALLALGGRRTGDSTVASETTRDAGELPVEHPGRGEDFAPGWIADRRIAAVLLIASAYIALTPALAGHASIESPVAVFFPADVVHVLAASVWVGGIACLLLVLPRATRTLEGPDRSRLLVAVLVRFSPLALSAVIAIALTGVVQAYIDVRSLSALVHTTYGVLILVKVGLLLALIALGWINRERVIPALKRLLAAERPPGEAGLLARRTMRGELALMLVVFGVTAALISYAPPIDADSGPFSTNTTLGPLELEMSVEPAKVGLNAMHLYLFNAKNGVQFTGSKELVVNAELPSKGIGPLPLRAVAAGPGHYVLDSAELSPGGDWNIRITERVSEFEEYSRVVKVPIQ